MQDPPLSGSMFIGGRVIQAKQPSRAIFGRLGLVEKEEICRADVCVGEDLTLKKVRVGEEALEEGKDYTVEKNKLSLESGYFLLPPIPTP